MLALIFCSGTSLAAVATDSEMVGLPDYPRIEYFEQGSVQVDFPNLESWPDFRLLKAWLPVEVSLNGDSKPQVGSVYVQAVTDINFDQRTVNISGLEVLKTRFSSDDVSGTRTKLIGMAFRGRERIVPLDVLLRLLPDKS